VAEFRLVETHLGSSARQRLHDLGPRFRGHTWAETETRNLVLGAAALMVLGMTAFNGWALYNGWFYGDDYVLFIRADRGRMGFDYLLEPHDARLLPGTRLLVWAVASAGSSWAWAATVTLLLKTTAAAAAACMLIRLFGARWAVLAPLALYLTTAITVPAMMWWTASLNQTPVQLSFFLAVGAWVGYLRTRRLRSLAVVVAALVLGLLFFTKVLLVVGVLGYLALAYFATGSLGARFRSIAVTYWPAVVAGLLVVGGYLGYASTVDTERPFRAFSAAAAGDVADSMLGKSFPTGILGGPWTWDRFAPPGSVADPPAWLASLSWVVLALVVAYGYLRRERTLRAWGLLGCYLAALLALMVLSRGQQFGGIVGLEYRYFTDVACVAALCVGLAFLPLRGAVEASRPRPDPYLRFAPSPRAWVVLVCVVSASGLLSSDSYVRNWHNGNLSEVWVKTLRGELRREGAIDLVDRPVPHGVIGSYFAPDNRLSRLAPLLSDEPRFPDWSTDLKVVADDGTVRQALIESDFERERLDRNCGWKVKEDGRTIRMPRQLFPWTWWIRIGYLSSGGSAVTVSTSGHEVEAAVEEGLGSLYVQVDGAVGDIRIDGLDEGVTLCVGAVEVGEPAAGGAR
jgi:hypothetical protein